ncbi:RNase H domain-containing protein [Trichonephila clavipes]|nr:RNase H domain-containing protein [Trichonephila clavipes]
MGEFLVVEYTSLLLQESWTLRSKVQILVQFLDRSLLLSEGMYQYACKTKVQFQDVWILTDSRASVQHLSNWISIGDQTSLDILNLLDQISIKHCAHFQGIPSHVGIDGNEKADFLARTAAEEELSLTGYLTFSDLSSLKKIELDHLGRTPICHPWYFGRNPGGSFRLMHRKYQTVFSRFASEKQVGRIDVKVARCWQSGSQKNRRGGSGRPKNTNDREDRAIRRVATSAPTTSLASIQRHLPPSRYQCHQEKRRRKTSAKTLTTDPT